MEKAQTFFVDTTALVRFVSREDPQNERIVATIQSIWDAGGTLCFTPQIARETWSVLTRPVNVGGFGLKPDEAAQLMTTIHSLFTFLDDTPDVYSTWLDLVRKYSVSGKQVHDANHGAAMLCHGIEQILTLDERDFQRYDMIEVRRP